MGVGALMHYSWSRSYPTTKGCPPPPGAYYKHISLPTHFSSPHFAPACLPMHLQPARVPPLPQALQMCVSLPTALAPTLPLPTPCSCAPPSASVACWSAPSSPGLLRTRRSRRSCAAQDGCTPAGAKDGRAGWGTRVMGCRGRGAERAMPWGKGQSRRVR